MRIRETRARAGRPGLTEGDAVGEGGVTRERREVVSCCCSCRIEDCLEGQGQLFADEDSSVKMCARKLVVPRSSRVELSVPLPAPSQSLQGVVAELSLPTRSLVTVPSFPRPPQQLREERDALLGVP
jgi:hypothetical protein